MLTEKQENDPFYMMDRKEFKKLAIRYVGGEIINLIYSRDIFGWNDEFNTFILAKKSYDPVTYREAHSFFYEDLGGNRNPEHVLVIALSFNEKFKKKVETDVKMEVISITVDELFKMDCGTVIPTIIAETIKRNTPLSRVFKPIKK